MTRDLAAAIDLGTNTALLLVARAGAGGALEVVEDHCRTPRLGAGLAARGVLDAAARERAIEALTFFAGRLAELGVARARTRAVGTAVLRRARDATHFVAHARERTGIEIEVIAAAEEARLGEVAVAAEGVSRDTFVVDVGGGSTEVACAALGLRLSVPIGAVVLTETYLSEPALQPGGFAALQEHARRAAEAFPAGGAVGHPVVVLGGTGVNLACLALALPRFDHRSAEGARIDAARARAFAIRLAGLAPAERALLPIEADRAAILPAGMACLAATLERLGAKEMRVTGRGLRFGVVRELLARLGNGKS